MEKLIGFNRLANNSNSENITEPTTLESLKVAKVEERKVFSRHWNGDEKTAVLRMFVKADNISWKLFYDGGDWRRHVDFGSRKAGNLLISLSLK